MNTNNLRLLPFYLITLSVVAFSSSTEAIENDGIESTAPRHAAAKDIQSNITKAAFDRYAQLMKLAPAALSAGQIEQARAYAQELLELRPKIESLPGFGPGLYANATHVGNLVLGRIALLAGDMEKAKEHLLAAARVSADSATLRSFGPNMLLAKELIEHGERQTAVEYFRLCSSFWKLEDGRLKSWTNVVTAGGVPDFGANIKYYLAN